MSQNLYSKRFNVLLEAEHEAVPTPDAEAATADLDPGVAPDAYDDVQGADAVADVKKQENAGQVQSLQGWIQEVDNFSEYMNGLGAESMQSQLNNSACDTLFAEIARSETKKIGRIAQDMRALSESLKAYLLSSDSE
jgi:hypothetical protein